MEEFGIMMFMVHSTVMKKLLVGYIIKKVGSESENS